MSKTMAIVYAELTRRQYALSIETLSKICGLNFMLIEEALTGLKHRGLIKAVKVNGIVRYRSRQLPLPLGSVA